MIDSVGTSKAVFVVPAAQPTTVVDTGLVARWIIAPVLKTVPAVERVTVTIVDKPGQVDDPMSPFVGVIVQVWAGAGVRWNRLVEVIAELGLAFQGWRVDERIVWDETTAVPSTIGPMPWTSFLPFIRQSSEVSADQFAANYRIHGRNALRLRTADNDSIAATILRTGLWRYRQNVITEALTSTEWDVNGYSEMAVSPSVSTAMGQGAATFPGSSLERANNLARSGVWWISPHALADLGKLELEPEVYFFDTGEQRIVSGIEHVA